MRCVHLNRVGEQCRDQALGGRQFCAYHARLLEDFESDDASRDEVLAGKRERTARFPLIYRLAAAILLFIFLLDAVPMLRSWLSR